MTTKLIGIKDFRENFTSMWKDARANDIRYIVMYHSTPILEINPIDEDDFVLESLMKDVKEARAQVKKGEVYSGAEVYKKLGIK